MKLNIGCGYDYREGFVNIDGNPNLPRVDRVIDLSDDALPNHFEEGSVGHILASDFIEHHYHWEAIQLLKDFFRILRSGGTIEMRLPDFEAIMTGNYPTRRKIIMLFGGQDIPQGEKDVSHRRRFPQYFCHKYAYTPETMTEELQAVGFSDIQTSPDYSNFIVTARKP